MPSRSGAMAKEHTKVQDPAQDQATTTLRSPSPDDFLSSSQSLDTPPDFKLSGSIGSQLSVNDHSAEQGLPMLVTERHRASSGASTNLAQMNSSLIDFNMDLSPPELHHYDATAFLHGQPSISSTIPEAGNFDVGEFLTDFEMGSSPQEIEQERSAVRRLRFDCASPVAGDVLEGTPLPTSSRLFTPAAEEGAAFETHAPPVERLVQAPTLTGRHTISAGNVNQSTNRHINTNSSLLSTTLSNLSEEGTTPGDARDAVKAHRPLYDPSTSKETPFILSGPQSSRHSQPVRASLPGPTVRSSHTWQILPPPYLNRLRSHVDPNFSNQNWGDKSYVGTQEPAFPPLENLLPGPQARSDKNIVERALQERAETIVVPEGKMALGHARKHVRKTTTDYDDIVGARTQELRCVQKGHFPTRFFHPIQGNFLGDKNAGAALTAPAEDFDEEFKDFASGAQFIPHQMVPAVFADGNDGTDWILRATSMDMPQRAGPGDLPTRTEHSTIAGEGSGNMKSRTNRGDQAMANVPTVNLRQIEDRRIGQSTEGPLVIGIHREPGSWNVQQTTYNVNDIIQHQKPMTRPPVVQTTHRDFDVQGTSQGPPSSPFRQSGIWDRSTIPQHTWSAESATPSNSSRLLPGMIGLGPWARNIGKVVWPKYDSFNKEEYLQSWERAPTQIGL